MSDELKPCPFCGGLAEIVEIDEGENAGGSCVCCTTCLASSKVEFGFKENFISNWNRRVQTIAPDAVARLWHAARLGLDMARANDLTNTAEMIMEAMNAVECPCKGSDEMCPCQNRRPAPDAVAPLVEAALRELVDELRLIGCHANGDARCTCGIGQDAADTITAQAEENRRLREALRPFAKAGELFPEAPGSVEFDQAIYKPAAGEEWLAAKAAAAAAPAENGRQRDAFLRLVSEAPVLSSSGGKA